MDHTGTIGLTLLLSALFSGLEIAYISANKLKIEVDKNKGFRYARVLSVLSRNPARFIGSMLVANNIVVVVFGILIEGALGNFLTGSLPGVLNNALAILVFQTIISALILLIIAEFVPKTIFRINPNGLLRFFTFPAYLIYLLLYPVVYVLTALSEQVLKLLFKVPNQNATYVFSMVDLDNYLREFSAQGEARAREMDSEIQIFQNAMDFRKVKVRECMVPRTELKALEENETVQEMMELAVKSGHSKILIYRDSIDNIIGYTHAFDLFQKPATIAEVVKPILIVPETMMANQALQLLLREHKSIAVVVDEFGGTSGIVTMEDIIEEIFGEISDEYDVDRLVERVIGKNEYLFSGRLEIDYLNGKYNFGLPVSEDYETLAGFIIHYHESIPEFNDEIVIEPFVFIINQASENRIELVRMRYNP